MPKGAKKRKKKSAKPPIGIGGMILTVVIVFAVVIGLMLWIQSQFGSLDLRLVETQKRVDLIGAMRALTGGAPSGSVATTSAGGSNGTSLTATQGSPTDTGPALETVIGRVVKAQETKSFWNVSVDPAQLLTGKAAASIAAHRGKVPINGQFLDDSTHAVRVIPCSAGAPVRAKGPRAGEAAPATAKALFAALDGADAGYWRAQYFRMTLDSDYIVGFEQFTLGP
ncbi:MAG: hypothetical protein WCP28_12595 [Actinomycetes bacterium]